MIVLFETKLSEDDPEKFLLLKENGERVSVADGVYASTLGLKST